MTPVEVHDYLRRLGRQWTGKGVAMELGCWLGASSVPLLEGLKTAGYDERFFAFDRWIANKQQVREAREGGIELRLNQNILPWYLANVLSVYSSVWTRKGNLPGTLTDLHNVNVAGPIEICIFDAPKQNPIFIDCIRALHKNWIPGVTILGLLDYHFWERKEGKMRKAYRAPVEFMERNKGCFTKLEEFKPASPAFFRFEKPLISI